MTQKSGKIDTTGTYYTFVTALLLLTAKVEGQAVETDDNIMMLRNLFEEALVNSSVSLFQLQQIYFNPSSHYSPLSVCVQVSVTVDNNISHPDDYDDNCNDPYDIYNIDRDLKPAFDCNDLEGTTSDTCKQWVFTSSYNLKLIDDGRDSAELRSFLTSSDNADMFYTFDPSFYNIMNALSTSSSEIPFPIYDRSITYDSSSPIYQIPEINIKINRPLENMPCKYDANNALKMVLVWVSLFCHGLVYLYAYISLCLLYSWQRNVLVH